MPIRRTLFVNNLKIMQKIPFEQSNDDDSGEDILNFIQNDGNSSGSKPKDLTSVKNVAEILEKYFVKKGAETSRSARTIKMLLKLIEDEGKLNVKQLSDIEFELQSVLSLVQKLKQQRLS